TPRTLLGARRPCPFRCSPRCTREPRTRATTRGSSRLCRIQSPCCLQRTEHAAPWQRKTDDVETPRIERVGDAQARREAPLDRARAELDDQPRLLRNRSEAGGIRIAARLVDELAGERGLVDRPRRPPVQLESSGRDQATVKRQQIV